MRAMDSFFIINVGRGRIWIRIFPGPNPIFNETGRSFVAGNGKGTQRVHLFFLVEQVSRSNLVKVVI